MPTAGKFFYNYILLNTNKQVVGITNDRALHIVTFYRIEISCATCTKTKGKMDHVDAEIVAKIVCVFFLNFELI